MGMSSKDKTALAKQATGQLTKRQRDKLSRKMRKAGLLKHDSLLTDLDRAKRRELKRQAIHKAGESKSLLPNVHLGNKVVKPDAAYYNPTGNTRTMASLKGGILGKDYKVAKFKRQKGAAIHKGNIMA